jgi:hypothetical protein
MCGKTAEIWNERTIPMREISAVKDGGLPRPVGTNQGMDMAGFDLKVYVADGDEALELLS